MSDDLLDLFGNNEDEGDEEYLSQFMETEEDDFFTNLRDSSQDDIFAAPQYEEEETPIVEEKTPESEETEWLETPETEDSKPVWYDEVMAEADLIEDPGDSAPEPKVKKPSAIGKFFKTGGPFGKLASTSELFGLSPQQRMILSIFLFVDVAILGCILLVLVGAIRL